MDKKERVVSWRWLNFHTEAQLAEKHFVGFFMALFVIVVSFSNISLLAGRFLNKKPAKWLASLLIFIVLCLLAKKLLNKFAGKIKG